MTVLKRLKRFIDTDLGRKLYRDATTIEISVLLANVAKRPQGGGFRFRPSTWSLKASFLE
jgi:hypothetical protein